MEKKLIFKNRPLFFEVFKFLMEICPHDNDILPGLFAGMTLASIGRDVGISRERVRQKRNRVLKVLTSQSHSFLSVNSISQEFKKNPDIQLFEWYSRLIQAITSGNISMNMNVPLLGWVRSSITFFKIQKTRSILIPTGLTDSLQLPIKRKKNAGTWYTQEPMIPITTLLPLYYTGGFFHLDYPEGDYFLRQIPEIVTEIVIPHQSVFLCLPQVKRLDKYMTLMFRHYSQMSFDKMTRRLQTLMQNHYPDGDWPIRLIREYVVSVKGTFCNAGMIGLSRSEMQLAGFKTLYSKDYIPLTKREIYQKRMADLVETSVSDLKNIIKHVYKGNKKDYSSWFHSTMLDNPLILLEIKKSFKYVNHYIYRSLIYEKNVK